MALITISGRYGCGRNDVAQAAAQKLGLELYDDQRLEESALRMGVHKDELNGLRMKRPALWDLLLSTKPDLYLDLLQAVVLDVARTGNGIIVGHASQMFLRNFGCALHVKIHASDSFRIRHIMDRHGMKQEEAEKLIRRNDDERRGFLKYAFGIDWNDYTRFDLVINREKVGTQLAANLIVEAGKSSEITACSLNALETMEKTSLAKRVEAELLRDGIHVHYLHIEVLEKGVVRLGGWTHSKNEKDTIVEVVKQVPGVSDVVSEIAVSPGRP
jgi:CMP/dCMP kinase